MQKEANPVRGVRCGRYFCFGEVSNQHHKLEERLDLTQRTFGNSEKPRELASCFPAESLSDVQRDR